MASGGVLRRLPSPSLFLESGPKAEGRKSSFWSKVQGSRSTQPMISSMIVLGLDPGSKRF